MQRQRIRLEPSFDELKKYLSDKRFLKRRLCIVTDHLVKDLYLEEVIDLLKSQFREIHIFVFPAGEEQKVLSTVEELYQVLIEGHFDRHDYLMALGGGVVGDLCGFAASTYLRGISLIQVPTTLLAQVDSSVGGKTGIDFLGFKNMIGSFYMAELVYMNVSVLKTLSDEAFSSGMAEVIKHGLIYDIAYYQWIMKHDQAILSRDEAICMEMIKKSNDVKEWIVREDPYESGKRAILNFGHTIGHGIEAFLKYRLSHGGCVALGAVAASYISFLKGNLSIEEVKGISLLFQKFGLPVVVDGIDIDQVMELMKSDKKMDSDQVRFILLNQIGDGRIDLSVTKEEIEKGLKYITR